MKTTTPNAVPARLWFHQALATVVACCLTLFAGALPAAPQLSPAPPTRVQANRVARGADLSARTRLPGHRPAWATGANDRGALAANTPVQLILGLTRDPAVQAAFEQLLQDQQNPASPRYHQWLTPLQVGEQFGPTASDLEALTDWFTTQGISVQSVAPSGIFVQASAPAAVVSAAFGTELRNYLAADGTTQHAPASEPTVPSALAPLIAHIAGLAEVRLHTHLRHTLVPIPAGAAQVQSRTSPATLHPDTDFSGGTHLLGPADIATIYDVNAAYSSGIRGTSQKVMIIGGSRLLASDLTTWETLSGLSAYQPNYIVPAGTGFADPGVTSDDNQAEGTLDFERVYGTAPGATVDQIISSNWLNGITNANMILYAIGTVNDPVMSLSFGSCESAQPSGYVAQEDSMYAVAAAQGISVLVSSGDAGVAGCEAHGSAAPASQTASISDICASGNVTCVGGTQFSDTASPSTYWSATNNIANLESALSYIPEGAWNEPTSTSANGTVSYVVAATGGGSSTIIARPSWQVGTGVTPGTTRLTPDVSFSASIHNGYYGCLAYAGANCTKYFEAFGGTSASAPLMAGVTALLDQKLGGRQGNLNPLLYKLAASTPAAFHDATPATSAVAACTTATPSTCNNSDPATTTLTGGIAGYPLTTGYDLATGLGSLDVNALLSSAVAPTLAPITVTLSALPATITTAQSTVFTATVTPSTSGSPTGTILFSANGLAFGSPVTLAGGSAITALESFTTAGTYNITAAYSGDSVYAAGTVSISLVVSAPTHPLTTTTVTPSASSVVANATFTLTAAVASTASGTPTGTVQFTANNHVLGSPVTLTAGKAMLPATTLAIGTYSIVGQYSGDGSFTGSTSPAVAFSVTAVPVTTSIVSPATGATFTSTQPIGVTASVTPSATSGGTPTGTVQFLVDGVQRGAAAILGFTQAFSPAIYLTPGSHLVTAAYSGDATFAASTSAPVSYNSTLTPTTIAFTPVPTVAASSLTATVSGLSAAVNTTASVIFKDGATTLGTPTITFSGSTATATLSSVTFAATGVHTVTAAFAGDTNYAPSNTATALINVSTFTLLPATANLSLASTSSASSTDVVTASTMSGFTGTIAFTCAVALNSGTATVPPNCSISPASLAFPTAGTTVTVTLGTVAPHDRPAQFSTVRGPGSGHVSAGLRGGALAFAGLLLAGLPLGLRRRGRDWPALALGQVFLALSAGLLLGLAGCGSGSAPFSGTGTTTTFSGGTTTGAYTVTITGTPSTGAPAVTTTIGLTVN